MKVFAYTNILKCIPCFLLKFSVFWGFKLRLLIHFWIGFCTKLLFFFYLNEIPMRTKNYSPTTAPTFILALYICANRIEIFAKIAWNAFSCSFRWELKWVIQTHKILKKLPWMPSWSITFWTMRPSLNHSDPFGTSLCKWCFVRWYPERAYKGIVWTSTNIESREYDSANRKPIMSSFWQIRAEWMEP